jgi:hypothetical protein
LIKLQSAEAKLQKLKDLRGNPEFSGQIDKDKIIEAELAVAEAEAAYGIESARSGSSVLDAPSQSDQATAPVPGGAWGPVLSALFRRSIRQTACRPSNWSPPTSAAASVRRNTQPSIYPRRLRLSI